MKIKYILTSLLLILSIKFYSQSWQNEVDFTTSYGNVFTSNSSIYNNTIDFDFSVNNDPIVAYSKESDIQLIVLKFDGTNWNTVGDLTFLSLSIGQVEIEVTSDDNIFIAFTDTNFQNLSIIKFNGSSWSYVAQNIADDEARELELDKDSNDNIYIAYKDSFNGNKATVKKYDFINNNIIDVGVEGFTAADIFLLNLDINPLTNEPYVIYINNQNQNVYVNKFDGVIWNQVGNYVTDSPTNKLDISFSSNGELIASTTEGSSVGPQSYAYVFDGGNWNPTAIASSAAPMLKSESDDNGNIYFAISDRGTAFDPDGINFIKYSNGNFENLEKIDIGIHFEFYLEMSFDNNNVPYVIYEPLIITNSHIKKFTTQLKINDFVINNIGVFPNPTSNYITINNLNLPTSYDIYDISGKLVSFGEVSNNKKIELSSLAKGIYFFKLKNQTSIKIIKK